MNRQLVGWGRRPRGQCDAARGTGHMSGIIGPATPGRIAFALATVGIGALAGGVIADRQDKDVTTGALIGGASAVVGLSLLYGGAWAWQRFGRAGATAGATAGASELATDLTRFTTPATTTASTSI